MTRKLTVRLFIVAFAAAFFASLGFGAREDPLAIPTRGISDADLRRQLDHMRDLDAGRAAALDQGAARLAAATDLRGRLAR